MEEQPTEDDVEFLRQNQEAQDALRERAAAHFYHLADVQRPEGRGIAVSNDTLASLVLIWLGHKEECTYADVIVGVLDAVARFLVGVAFSTREQAIHEGEYISDPFIFQLTEVESQSVLLRTLDLHYFEQYMEHATKGEVVSAVEQLLRAVNKETQD